MSALVLLPTREQLIHKLYEAAEIEHNLMCTYLYAAFTLKDGEAEGLSAEEAADRIVELVQHEFPLVKLFVRAWDRGHAIDLIHKDVAFQIRDTFESALVFGEAALRGLGVEEGEAAEITAEVRRRDAERLDLQVAGGIYAGNDLMIGNAPRPGPLTRPRQPGKVVGEAPADIS